MGVRREANNRTLKNFTVMESQQMPQKGQWRQKLEEVKA
jgi:hypothetical protein